MPHETETEVRSSTPRVWAPREPHLFVVIEGERPLASGMRCALRDVDEVLLGRAETRTAACAPSAPRRLILGIPDRKISARHARLFRDGPGWRVEDAGSTNGSFVNAERVTSQLLVDGDLIDVGRTLLRFRAALPTPAESTAVVSGTDDRHGTLGLGTLLPALAGELGVVARMTSSGVPVLLLGDTGTGKEVLARAIHTASKRSGPFVAVNCAALPDSLVEAQLFGHTKGAFSGAVREELGFVRSADGGTLFLDEVGDLPRAAQAVLLRVLQESEVVPVGASRAQRVDLRVVAATHQPLDAMIERGDFRSDLYARLHGFTHRLWRLGDRQEDIGVLVADLLPGLWRGDAGEARIAVDAARALVSHGWPLNVRELVQCLSRALALTRDGSIALEHFAPGFATPRAAARAPATAASDDDALRATLIEHLVRQQGNVAAVAREMNKAPMQVYRWMRRLGVDPSGYR